MERLVEKPRENGESGGFSISVTGVRFRPMRSADVAEVMEIERASFVYPWSTSFFVQELKVTCARSLLAFMGGKVVGYVIYWLLPREIDVHNLAVHPTYRRRGIGKALLQAVIGEARHRGLTRVTLEVRKSNEAAQKLYQAAGFVAQGVRSGYYTDDGEDAVLMVLEVPG